MGAEAQPRRTRAPGLKWIKRAAGAVPVWVADERDVKAGYLPKTVNLTFLAADEAMLIAKCNALQADMLLWRTGYRRDPLHYDGTIGAVLSIYQRHPESGYHRLKPASRKPYDHYLARLESHIGRRAVAAVTGLDIIAWHRVWSSDGAHLAAAAMARAVLEAALAFGIIADLTGCDRLKTVLVETRSQLPGRSPRDARIDADAVTALRAAAHAAGRPSLALAYAIVFETTLRLWDTLGQWVPLGEPGLSDVVDRGRKWLGLRWEDIGEDLVLRYRPSKTDRTTGATMVYPLALAPMVMEEIGRLDRRPSSGPVIVAEATGRPWRSSHFGRIWREDAAAAGIDVAVWARDLRASGISEGRAGGATTDDVARVAAHSPAISRAVYDRATLEAATRIATLRAAERTKNEGGNGSGNAG